MKHALAAIIDLEMIDIDRGGDRAVHVQVSSRVRFSRLLLEEKITFECQWKD